MSVFIWSRIDICPHTCVNALILGVFYEPCLGQAVESGRTLAHSFEFVLFGSGLRLSSDPTSLHIKYSDCDYQLITSGILFICLPDIFFLFPTVY